MNPLLELLAVGIYVAIGILLVVFTYMCIGCCTLVETRETLHAMFTTKHQANKSTQSPENEAWWNTYNSNCGNYYLNTIIFLLFSDISILLVYTKI